MKKFKGVFEALAMLVVLIGVPVLLVKVAGNPLPTSIPNPSNMLRAARQNDIRAEVVINFIAVIAWVLWALILWAVIWEVAVNVPAMIAGRKTRRPPGVPVALATVVAHVVFAVVTLLTPMKTAVASSALPTTVPAVQTVQAATPAPTVETPAAPQASSAPTWTVKRGDTLWSIAEQTLGDGSRVDEIISLNPQHSTPTRLPIGVTLELPSDAAAAQDSKADQVVVERGDTLWDLVDEHDGSVDMDRIYDVAEQNSIADPNLIFPGQQIDLATEAAQPEAEQPVEAPPTQDKEEDEAPTRRNVSLTEAPSTAPVTGLDAPAAPSDSTVGAEQTALAPPVLTPRASDGPERAPSGSSDTDIAFGITASNLVPFGQAALLAGGVVALIAARRRRLWRQRCGPGTPSDDMIAVERRLRAGLQGRAEVDTSDDDLPFEAAGHLDPEMRLAIIVAAAQDALSSKDARLMAVADGEVTATAWFNNDISLPAPWAADGSGWSVRFDEIRERFEKAADLTSCPNPTLVQLGRDVDSDIYVDLESLRTLEIGGPEPAANAIVAAIATTLATRQAMSSATLIAVGVPSEIFIGHDGLLRADSFEVASAQARAAVGSSVAQIEPMAHLRSLSTSGDSWDPAVVFAGSATDKVRPIDAPGTALVSAAPVTGPSQVLSPEGDQWILRPLGLRCRPIGLDPNEVQQVSELCEAASRPATSGEALAARPAPIVGEPLDPPSPSGHTVGGEPILVVRLLGPVTVEDIHGVRAAFDRSVSQELVAWLATHRELSTRTAARGALWNYSIRDKAFANVISDARRAMNAVVAPPTGQEWIGRTSTELLPLHPLVTSDADLVQQAVLRASTMPAREAVELLRPRVDMLRGAPFEGSQYLWPDSEGITSRLVLLATEAAVRLAETARAIDDLETTLFATERGLSVLAGHVRLTELRMRAFAALEDAEGVAATWGQYEVAICDDAWGPTEPDPILIELRNLLLRPVG